MMNHPKKLINNCFNEHALLKITMVTRPHATWLKELNVNALQQQQRLKAQKKPHSRQAEEDRKIGRKIRKSLNKK